METQGEWGKVDVDDAERRTEEEGALDEWLVAGIQGVRRGGVKYVFVCGECEAGEVTLEAVGGFCLGGYILCLQDGIEGGDDVGVDVVDPEATIRFQTRI